MNQLRHCPKCGRLGGNEVYCTFCGANMDSEQQQTIDQIWEDQSIQSTPKISIEANHAKGIGWIILLKVCSWLVFSAIIIAGYGIASTSNNINNNDPTLSFLILICSIILAFVVVAWTMVQLNTAENIAKNAENTKIIIDLLQKINNNQVTPQIQSSNTCSEKETHQ